MVEVFKTNVQFRVHANLLLAQIHRAFAGYRANFDLDDCDRILRVQSSTGDVAAAELIGFLKPFGCVAVVLPDEVPTTVSSPHLPS
ncbi:hypothetical protein [Chitinophaga vietnamensis]|uniref:hypothetical protein n=1 Tax=Chitinophaga vietnamensis TaxID=2593957 RepID=UPI0011774923|nr:hypothetical protein [Chitinophaga vietnamensis]